jgi:uncharacterized protein (TIGR00369 family)
MPRMTAAEIDGFLAAQFPQAHGHYRITAIGADDLEVVLPFRDADLRPGGTLSGPALMALADSALYFLILAQLGPVALAVTTSFNINFLRRPPPADVHATARLLKLGARLIVGEVHLRDPAGALVAHATATYALPP